MKNRAAQALQMAASEIERLEAALEDSELYFAFLLLGDGKVSTSHNATLEFTKAVRSGNICIMQNLVEHSHEFILGVRDGAFWRPMTDSEREGHIVSDSLTIQP